MQITPVVKRFNLTKKTTPTINQIKVCLLKHFGVNKSQLSEITKENVDTKWEEFTH